jgi:7-cyano-7-deazaguanine synthase
MSAAVVLFSGGQDSTTCLYWALSRYKQVQAIGVDYGQRHRVELQQAQKIAELANVPYTLLPFEAWGRLSISALTETNTELNTAHRLDRDLPASFVPGRNLLLLTLAGSFAYGLGIQTLVGGMCQTDYSGYPDCRQPFVDATSVALSLALDQSIDIQTPLMHLTKAQTWLLARDLGCLEVVIEHSHTCYNGDRDHRHAWGYGCGTCPACELRQKGWEEASLG